MKISHSSEIKNNGFDFSENLSISIQIEQIIELVAFSYLGMIDEGVTYKKSEMPRKRENYYRTKLVRLMDKFKVDKGLSHILFDCESEETDDDCKVVGLLDIKVRFIKDNAAMEPYYRIECKRINSTYSSYIKTGIVDFIDKKYSKDNNNAAMIGFIEKGEIDRLIEKINKYLEKHHGNFTTNYLDKIELNIDSFDRFKEIYLSIHKRKKSDENIKIYHLMLDYTDIYIPSK